MTSPDREPLGVCVLGATGSVGRQTLSVCRAHPKRLAVRALAAGSDALGLSKAARAFNVKHLALGRAEAASDLAAKELSQEAPLGFGEAALEELVALPEVDCVVVALVGAVAIAPTLAALKAGKRVALANKECLVAAGTLIMKAARPGQLIPVDSEHSAIFQCLVGEPRQAVRSLWLTCSGGPFYGFPRERLTRVSAEQALAHPTWAMGPKITIDSATLMNKGLEVIEACHLFGVGPQDIHVLIHPESLIHSMVEFADGATKAQLGPADMRIPIQYALSYPERWDCPAKAPDWRWSKPLSFGAPDLEAFRCLGLALEAARVGGTLPCAMNAANEVANAAFREGAIGFCDIDTVVEVVMGATTPKPVVSLDQILAVDSQARETARLCIKDLEE